jgi:MFS family permease
VVSNRLFTPRFLVMCAYSFTVFLSVFQLLPTAPYHVLDLGGSTAAAGLFLGCLTFSSAFSAPVTGAIGDRFGQRRVLIVVSASSAVFSLGYAVITNIPFLLTVVVLHGIFWSALLSASGAYMTATIPESRRAEGISYWGMMSTISLAVAPSIGFWVYRHGWVVLCIELVTLNVLMAIIAWRLPDDREVRSAESAEVRSASDRAPRHSALPHSAPRTSSRRVVDWRVLLLSVTMALVSFGYGALTSFSALFADALHITPRGLFLIVMAGSMLAIRLALGRSMDGMGHRRVLITCLAAPAAGLLMLAFAEGPVVFNLSAVVFGLGMSLMYPSFTAYVLRHVPFNRRGAAFGAMLAAFDTGVGSGSSVTGWLVQRAGYRPAFVCAAALALLSLPYFLLAEKYLGFKDSES